MPGVGFGFNPMDPNSPSPPLGQGAGGVGGGANAPNYAAGKLNNEPQLAVNRQPQALRERMEILKSQFLKNESLSMDIAASLLLGDIPSLYRPSEYVPDYQYDRNPYLGGKKHDFIADISVSYEVFQQHNLDKDEELVALNKNKSNVLNAKKSFPSAYARCRCF